MFQLGIDALEHPIEPIACQRDLPGVELFLREQRKGVIAARQRCERVGCAEQAHQRGCNLVFRAALVPVLIQGHDAYALGEIIAEPLSCR